MNTPANRTQHLIDPEICIRCNTCEATCPIGAITHNDDNYVVDASKCNQCMACVPPCPTGAIDNWRQMADDHCYSLDDQFSWEELPTDDVNHTGNTTPSTLFTNTEPAHDQPNVTAFTGQNYSAQIPPWSAAHPYTNLYGGHTPAVGATVVGNVRVTSTGSAYDTHHIVLDFGSMPFPVLEGQSIGIIPPGVDHQGNKTYQPRQYSVASPRNGERSGYNNVALTVKRVLEDYQGNAVTGVASNYLCDLDIGATVQVVGPFGQSFLMPNHPDSNLIMICTGTGSAPMRAMTEWRRRLRASGKYTGGKLLLFFGARSPEELPYFGPLQKLPHDFIDLNFAFSRAPQHKKQYVQDVLRQRRQDIGQHLTNPHSYFYLCGLRAMEEGVILALRDSAEQAKLSWPEISHNLKQQGRLHIETY